MISKKKRPRLKYIGILLLSFIILSAVVGVGLYAVRNINYSQYNERVENSNILMEKICNHIETAIEFNWDSIHYVANQLENDDFTSVSQMLEYVANCEKNIKGDENTKILLISDKGMCYVTDGTEFRWESPSLLSKKTDAIYVSEHQLGSTTGVQMRYLSSFSVPIEVEGIKFTHASLVCDMKELDSFFDIENYGKDSITFIIHKDGSMVYRQDKETELSGIYNLLSALKKYAEFGYGESFEEFQKGIEENKNDCVYLTYNEKDYFVSYHKLDIKDKDWVAVLMVPEEYVGTGTQVFTQEIIESVVMLFGGILLVLAVFIVIAIHQIEKKHKLVNNQLLKAAEAERSANEAKTNFLSSMSHDIRTPMNAIVGMSRLAMDNIDNRDYAMNCLGKVQIASAHLLTLINDVLDISKVESGKMTLRPSVISIEDEVEHLVEIIMPQVKEKDHKFTYSMYGCENKMVYADKLRMNQILLNLLSNAVKYTEPGGKIEFTVSGETVDDGNNLAVICTVRDNGIGMSEEYQKTMYENFSREDNEPKRNIQGSGLGLAICKQLVELMGGSIECESIVGVGTVFTVNVVLELRPDRDHSEPEAQVEERDISNLTGLKFLVAEDNDFNWEVISEVLKMKGIETVRAENGQICLDMMLAAEDGAYDMVFMDVKMPKLNGYQTTAAIRSSEREYLKNIPIVAMTADAFAEDIHKCFESGMNDHIAKPLDMDTVIRVIHKYCSK